MCAWRGPPDSEALETIQSYTLLRADQVGFALLMGVDHTQDVSLHLAGLISFPGLSPAI